MAIHAVIAFALGLLVSSPRAFANGSRAELSESAGSTVATLSGFELVASAYLGPGLSSNGEGADEWITDGGVSPRIGWSGGPVRFGVLGEAGALDNSLGSVRYLGAGAYLGAQATGMIFRKPGSVYLQAEAGRRWWENDVPGVRRAGVRAGIRVVSERWVAGASLAVYQLRGHHDVPLEDGDLPGGEVGRQIESLREDLPPSPFEGYVFAGAASIGF